MVAPSSEPKKLPLTFGIEIEFAFAIRNDLEHYPEHWWLRPENLGIDRRYRCNLTEDAFENPSGKDEVSSGLCQAAVLIGNQGGQLRTKKRPGAEDESFDKFCRWNLFPEDSVVFPDTPDELFRWSNGVLAVDRPEQIDDWDWTGLELISPALRVPDVSQNQLNGLVELNGYLGFMKHQPDAPYIFMAHPEISSVHVHIGVQPQETEQLRLPLDLLRHVAWICLLFEDTITLLHHPERHSYPDSQSRDYATSNRKILNAEHSKHNFHCCSLRGPFSPEDTFMKIFNYEQSNETIATLNLVVALSTKKDEDLEGDIDSQDLTRYLFVNFENLVRGASTQSKKTIEFRQHHGTISTRDTNEWVIFLTSLVRAAERLSLQSPDTTVPVPPKLVSKIFGKYEDPILRDQALREAAKYAHILREDRRSLKQLFDLLELPLANRTYWWNRAKKFQAEIAENWVDKSQSICDDLYCPNKPIRDCEGWEEGELDKAPWDGADEDCEYEEEAEEEEDCSVPMEIDEGPNPEKLIPRTTSTPTLSLIVADDEEGEPMDIDDDVPSPVAP